MEIKECILCAAIWFKEVNPRATHRPINTPGGVVLCGFRHGDIISQVLPLTEQRQFELGEHIQGFLTNKNRFVDREEGAEIFIAGGGTLKYSETKLYSEDLY
jgi:hypothetical protein